MSTDERPRRPPLERTEPIRNWSQLLRTPGEGSAAEGGQGGLGDVVSRSVELGYRVIDDYVRQGQRAAQRIREGEYGPERWGQDAQDLGQRMLQHASELAATWLQLLDRSTGARPADGRPAPAAAASSPRSAPDGAVAARLRVEVAAVEACSVVLEIGLEAARGRLSAHSLRAADVSKPRIDAIEIEPGNEERATVLRITVPPHHAAGTYEGLVMDADTSRPVGVVRVVVAEPASR
jgi:hypothetical protein